MIRYRPMNQIPCFFFPAILPWIERARCRDQAGPNMFVDSRMEASFASARLTTPSW